MVRSRLHDHSIGQDAAGVAGPRPGLVADLPTDPSIYGYDGNHGLTLMVGVGVFTKVQTESGPQSIFSIAPGLVVVDDVARATDDLDVVFPGVDFWCRSTGLPLEDQAAQQLDQDGLPDGVDRCGHDDVILCSCERTSTRERVLGCFPA